MSGQSVVLKLVSISLAFALAAASYVDAQTHIVHSRNLTIKIDDDGSSDEDAAAGLLSSTTPVGLEPRIVLRSNPLDVAALSKVAEINDAEGGDGNADALISLGKVTRRSRHYLIAELKNAVERNDLERVVNTLARLASIEPTMRKDIFLTLASVFGNSDGVKYLARLQSRKWFPALIESGSRSPETVYQVGQFLLMHRPVDPVERENALRAVLTGLLAQNAVGQAQEFAARFSGASVKELNSLKWPRIDIDKNPLPVEWRFPNPRVSVVNDEGGQVQFTFEGDPGSAAVAEKTLTLSDGIYAIQSEYSSSSGSDTRLHWTVRCGAQPVKQTVSEKTARTGSNKIVTSAFESSPHCLGYRVSLYVIASMDGFQRHTINVSNPTLVQIR